MAKSVITENITVTLQQPQSNTTTGQVDETPKRKKGSKIKTANGKIASKCRHPERQPLKAINTGIQTAEKGRVHLGLPEEPKSPTTQEHRHVLMEGEAGSVTKISLRPLGNEVAATTVWRNHNR